MKINHLFRSKFKTIISSVQFHQNKHFKLHIIQPVSNPSSQRRTACVNAGSWCGIHAWQTLRTILFSVAIYKSTFDFGGWNCVQWEKWVWWRTGVLPSMNGFRTTVEYYLDYFPNRGSLSIYHWSGLNLFRPRFTRELHDGNDIHKL